MNETPSPRGPLATALVLARPAALAASLAAAPTAAGAAEPPADLVAAAEAAGEFTVLLAALEGAGLVDELRGDGPFTLFAPTDEAFEALPVGTIDALLAPSNRDDLVALLHYHVVPGRIGSKDIGAMVEGVGMQEASIESLDGLSLVIENQAGVTVDGASLLETDIEAGNGVVHAIDTVLLPDAS